MKVYLANAMTGQPQSGFPWFDRARDYLLGLGHEVVSPADIDRDYGFDGNGEVPAGFTLANCLRRDFAEIVTCDAIAFGPDWATSRGARAERTVGAFVGCEFWRVDPDAPSFEREVVIGLSGYARVGKDTCAQVLVERSGFERAAFADALKALLYRLNPAMSPVARVATVVDVRGWESAKQDIEIRQLLQRLGTEAGRKVLGEDVWVNALFAKATAPRLVISDCRFPNEAQAIKDRGGVIVRVERPGFGPINNHPSETSLDDWDFDIRIVNDGSLDELAAKVGTLTLLAEVTA